MTHYSLVHKFILLPQAMKIPDAKAAVDKEWKKLDRQSQHGNWRQSKKQEGSCSRSTRRQKESPFCYTGGHMTPQKRGVRTKYKSIKTESYSEVTL